MKQSDSFYDKIYRAVQQIPPGKVATYGQIASMAGNGNAARILRSAAMKNSSAFSKRREWR